MQALDQIEAAVKQLSREQQELLRQWLENLIEDQMEMTDEFKAKIERGEQGNLSNRDWPPPGNLP